MRASREASARRTLRRCATGANRAAATRACSAASLGPACGLGRAGRELLDLGAQLAAARVELEQHRLGGLAGEPQLAAVRIPADARPR